MALSHHERVQALFSSVRDLTPEKRQERLDRECAGDPRLRSDVEALVFSRLKQIALRAIRLSGRAREQYLGQACAGDTPLRREVESLIAGDGTAAERVDRLVDRAQVALPPQIALPAQVGPFRLVDILGEGGMGTVYRAEQQEPIRREVALKVIRFDGDSAGARARLDAERQTLARLEHPNIARVLDAGTDDAGRPYFAMELVRGEPITDHCRKTDPSLKQRVGFVLDVARAVGYSHRRGIIHRDLKPSNLLVTLTRGEPEIKVIDFGIAKVLESPGLETSFRTRTGQVVGTLEYMSPEQACGDVAAVDTRSDVWALGVILYELLAGQRPFDFRDLPMHEAVRRITHDRPAPLRKGTTLSGMRVDPDLETIVGKCLEKAPDRRYGSGSELADDLERYLTSRPILARPPSVTYRVQMLARRHRGAVVAVAALSIAILGGVVGTSVGLVRARDEARRARTQATIAEEVNRFLNEDLLAPDAIRRQGVNVTMSQVLNVAGTRLDGRFPDRPQIEAELRHTVGQTYAELGDYAEAAKHLRRSLELRRSSLGERDPATLRAMGDLGWALRYLGRYEEAQALLDETVRGQRDLHGAEDPVTLASSTRLVEVLSGNGRHVRALSLSSETLETARRVFGDEHEQTLSAMEARGFVLVGLQRPNQAEALYSQALDGRRHGDDPIAEMKTQSSLARVYGDTGRPQEAESLLLDLVETSTRQRGENHPRTLHAKVELAMLYGLGGDLARAEPMLLEVFEARKQVLGADAEDTWRTLFRLGIALEKAGLHEEAGRRYDEAAEGLRVAFGTDQVLRVVVVHWHARLLVRTGQLERGAELHRWVHAVSRRRAGLEHGWTLETGRELVLVLIELGLDQEAVDLLLEMRQPSRRVLGRSHVETRETLQELASVLEAEPMFLEELGKGTSKLATLYGNGGQPPPEEAEPLFVDLVETSARRRGEDHPGTLAAKVELAMFYGRGGDIARAESMLIEAFEARRRVLGNDAEATWWTLFRLGRLLEKAGLSDRADRRYGEAAEGLRVAPGVDPIALLDVLQNHARLLVRTGQPERGAEFYREAVDGYRQTLGLEHTWTLHVCRAQAWLQIRLGLDQEAAALLRELLEPHRRTLGPEVAGTLQVQFQLARVLARSEPSESLELLADLVDRGWADARLVDDERLIPLRRFPQFVTLEESMRERFFSQEADR